MLCQVQAKCTSNKPACLILSTVVALILYMRRCCYLCQCSQLASMQCDDNDGTYECTNLINDACEGRRPLAPAVTAAGAALLAGL
jgi:hypothetical protein